MPTSKTDYKVGDRLIIEWGGSKIQIEVTAVNDDGFEGRPYTDVTAVQVFSNPFSEIGGDND